MWEWVRSKAERGPDRPLFVGNDGSPLLSRREFLERVESVALPAAPLHAVRLGYSLNTVIEAFAALRQGMHLRLDLPAGGSVQYAAPPESVPAPCVWIPSSATYRGAVHWPLSRTNLTWNLPEYCAAVGVDESNRLWSAFPPHTVSGWRSLFIALESGGSLLWEAFPRGVAFFSVFDAIERAGITSVAFPPAYIRPFLETARKTGKRFSPQVARVLAGGDYIAPELEEEFLQVFGRGLGILYGLTETAGPVSFRPAQEAPRPSIGRLFKGAWKTGADARLMLQGKFISPAHKEEWFTTSDCARIEGDGSAVFTGRKEEWISAGGRKWSLLELETRVLALEGIAECQVVAGETRCTLKIVPSEGADPDENRILERWPDELPAPEIRFQEKLDRTATGKIRRRESP